MAMIQNPYQPDYAVPPGWVLADMLDARELSHAEFARRCGRSPKLISEIIAGKAPLEPETALQFERVLGMDASVWLNMEADYQLHRARREEEQKLREQASWAAKFPIKDLARLGVLPKPEDMVDTARKLLGFFRVGTVEAWRQRYSELAVSYRHSRAFDSTPEALTAWLRVGEIFAERQACAEYDRSRFLQALREIRGLTRLAPEAFLPRMTELCNGAGVAFVPVPPLPKTALSSITRWLTPHKALIQQTLRHKTNDHFWFTFFHEAAHILLHSKKEVFLDDEETGSDEQEREANEWTTNFLVPRPSFEALLRSQPISKQAVVAFSEKHGIAPGIVVGMLQHKGAVPWSHLNRLKKTYDWAPPNEQSA